MKDFDEPSENEYSLTKVSAAVKELRAFKVGAYKLLMHLFP